MAGNKKIIEALDSLEKDRGIKKEVVIDELKEALEKSYKRNYLSPDSIVRVDIDPNTFKITMHEIKTVVEEVDDDFLEISLEDARAIKSSYQIGDLVESTVSPDLFGRLAASQTKSILRQKIREAEKDNLYNEFIEKKDELVSGIVDRANERFAIINIGKTGAYLGAKKMIPGETLVEGQQIKVYITDVEKTTKGTNINVSRVEPAMVKRLFELEVPEIYEGIVEIVEVSREPGERSKIAVCTKNPDVDPIGACVGQKGTRVKNIVDELNGEMIDIVVYDKDPVVYIKNALSPAKVIQVNVDEDTHSAMVIVPDDQLSLAIGKKGQNARLAARLTGWKIDIKSKSECIELGLIEAQNEESVSVEDENDDGDMEANIISMDDVEEEIEPVHHEEDHSYEDEDDEDDEYDEYDHYYDEIDYDEFDKYYD